MKTFIYRFILAVVVAIPMSIVCGCGREVSHTEHTETDQSGNTTKHEETTVTRNPDDTTTVQHEKDTSSH
jgi:hypothetical protein